MLGFGRALMLMLLGLTVVYFCLFFYLRSGARMRLEEDWAEEGRPGDMDEWVDQRVEPVAARIRVWLVVAVYVIPVVGLMAFVWLTN